MSAELPTFFRCPVDLDGEAENLGVGAHNRLAMLDEETVLVGTSSRVYAVYVAAEAEVEEGQGDELLAAIKAPFDEVCLEEFVAEAPIANVRSVELEAGQWRVGCVDEQGRAQLSLVNKLDACEVELKPLYSVKPEDEWRVGRGWCDVAFNPMEQEECALARSAYRTVSVYDGEDEVRRIGLPNAPRGVTYVDGVASNSSSLLAVIHNTHLSLFDPRASERAGCVVELLASDQPLYAVASKDGYLYVGGADKSVSVFEHRKLAKHATWRNAIKYDVHHVLCSSKQSPSMLAYVCGTDSELCAGVCTDSKGESNELFEGLRTPGKIMAVDRAPHSDTVAMMVEWQGLYIIRDADCLHIHNVQALDESLARKKSRRAAKNAMKAKWVSDNGSNEGDAGTIGGSSNKDGRADGEGDQMETEQASSSSSSSSNSTAAASTTGKHSQAASKAQNGAESKRRRTEETGGEREAEEGEELR